MSDQPMQGRVALVAGASKGIGAVTARAFAAAGAAVVLGARDIAALESVAAGIEADGAGHSRSRPTWRMWIRCATWSARR